jgi:integrase
MSLYKRGHTWHYDFSFAGGRFRGSTNEAVHSRARKIESVVFAEVQSKKLTALPRRAPLLRDFAVRFLQWVDAAQLEPTYYHDGWKILKNTGLAQMQIDRITRDEIESVRLPGSPSNVNRALRTIRRMLGKAEEWNLIARTPRVKLVKEYGRSTIIDKETEEKLLAVCKQPLRDVLILMLDSGMRPQEVFRMRWENVNWEKRTTFVPFGKTRNSRRHVPLSLRAIALLNERKTLGGSPFVFPANSKSGHVTTVEKAFLAARSKAGISKQVVLYCARHRFATDALAGTGNLAVVMRALGHSNAQTAMIYQHPSIETVRDVIDSRNATSAMSQNASQSQTATSVSA